MECGWRKQEKKRGVVGAEQGRGDCNHRVVYSKRIGKPRSDIFRLNLKKQK